MSTHKVVYADSHGGFYLSVAAGYYLLRHGIEEPYRSKLSFLLFPHYKERREGKGFNLDIPRHHPLLVACVEELDDATGAYWTELGIHELSGNQYRIDEFDGMETIEEPHDLDWITIDE